MKNKILVFDMDGTIADLYGVENWLEYLRSENEKPYIQAKPLYDMDTLNTVIKMLKENNWYIVVTSWLAKDSSKDYNKKIRKAKKDWLEKYSFPYDELHLIKYGTTKANCTRKKGGVQILVDDNEKIRNGWKLGDTINAKENIIKDLISLLLKEYN